MATILIGYDTESAAIGEALARMGNAPRAEDYAVALEPDTTATAVDRMLDVHARVGVPGTMFVCGRTMLHALPAIQRAAASGILDVQQHTYTHLYFRDVTYAAGGDALVTLPASPLVALEEEVQWCRGLLERHLGVTGVGIRTPFGYYQGLQGRSDLLGVLDRAGIRYVSSWGRNEQGGQPTPWFQPHTYARDGLPHLLELPFQGWLDVTWFDEHGFDAGDSYLSWLKGAVDTVVEGDLVWGTCFHDWTLVASDERRVGWLRSFLEYAVASGATVTSYTEYWRERST
jgi:peptidoglycan/xylan/chitin deacetylase (PgdA/CDA1 family)